MMRTLLIFMVMATLLTACGSDDDHVKIGAKNFGESRVLANMMAELATAQGFSNVSVSDYQTTQSIQQALKQGDIDAYPEYNGTALTMLGQNPMTDGDAAMARVKELYEPLGMTWLTRIGFANTYGLAMRPARAEELGVQSISDLVEQTDSLTFGIEDDFQKRPLDGFQPLLQRYALAPGATEVVALDDRGTLYDKLLDAEVDVIEVYTTDGQLADYNLTVLQDDLEFFPVYEAAIVARSEALSRHKGLGGAFEQLAGKIDEEAMRDLNRKVDIEGRSPQEVARNALAGMELIEGRAVKADEPLWIAASPFLSEDAVAKSALRAARAGFPGRDVQLLPDFNPLEKLKSSDSRLAMVGADELFDLSRPAPVRDDTLEAVAALGQNLIHIIVNADGPKRIDDVKTFATGPDGSPSHKLAALVLQAMSLEADLIPVEALSAADLLAQVVDGSADAALISIPEGDGGLLAVFNDNPLALLDIPDWSAGSNLIRYPFLRQARISAATYAGQESAVETIGAQLVLAGPAPVKGKAVGDQGPSSIATNILPISDTAVLALNEAVPDATLIDPTLQLAAALSPVLPTPLAALNPSPDISFLSIGIFLLFIWLIWLYVQPEYN